MDLDQELVIASENGNETTVNELLQKGANPSAMGPNSGALHCAAFEGHENIVKALLEKGANPNVADAQSFYPLLLAASKKELDICKLLLDNNADVNVTTSSLGTVLHIAAAVDFHEILELPQIKSADIEARDNEGKTPLNVAASLGNLEMVKELVALGADVNSLDDTGDSVLINTLSRAENIKVTEWQSLGENSGVKVKYQIVNGCFRYIKPYHGDANELGKVLPREDQEEIAEYFWGPADHLPYLKSLEIAEFLIENGADVHHVGHLQNSPMISACSLGEPDIMIALFKKGASLHVKDDKGITTLHYIARSKRLDALQAYFKLSDDKNANLLDGKNWTPAHFLGDLGGHPEMAKLLIAYGVDLNQGGDAFFDFKDGVKAFEVAEHWNDPEMAKLLSPENQGKFPKPNEELSLKLLATDEIDLDIFSSEDEVYDLPFESVYVEPDNLFHLLSLLFDTKIESLKFINGTYYDLTHLKDNPISMDDIDAKFDEWFEVSKRVDDGNDRIIIKRILKFLHENKEEEHLVLIDPFIWNIAE